MVNNDLDLLKNPRTNKNLVRPKIKQKNHLKQNQDMMVYPRNQGPRSHPSTTPMASESLPNGIAIAEGPLGLSLLKESNHLSQLRSGDDFLIFSCLGF